MSQLVSISDGTVTAVIDSKGAGLTSLVRGGGEYLWQGDARFWKGQAPILFPIVGCLRGNRASSAAGEVRLGRHGLARNYEHEVVRTTASSVTFELASNEATRELYPYDFRLNMTYAVEAGTLSQTYEVTNTGTDPLPFTLGGHPAFNVPAPGCEGEAFSDYALEFDEAWVARTPAIDTDGLHDFATQTVVIDGEVRLPLTHELFEELLTVTFQDVPGRHVRLVGPSGHGVELSFPGFDYLGVWTAGPEAPFVAVEPWCGCATAYDEPDVLEEKRGIITLAPGESCARTFTIRHL